VLWAHGSEVRLRQASAAYESGDLAAAIRLYREFLKDFPDAAEIRSNLGAALVRDGQFADARTEYNLALRRVPNNSQVRMNLALAYYKLGRLAEAVTHLEVLHNLQPRDGESAESAFLLGQSELLRNDLVAAVGHLARAVELNPKMPWAHTLYGQALRREGRLEQANAQFNEELQVNPYDFTANTEVAMLLRQDGKLDEALAHVTLALQVRPNDPGVLYQRASIHLRPACHRSGR